MGLGVSIWPYVIPPTVTIWDSATPRSSRLFTFVGAIVLVPIVFAYTGYAYWVFRASSTPKKATPDADAEAAGLVRGLWLAGVLTVGAVAFPIRAALL